MPVHQVFSVHVRNRPLAARHQPRRGRWPNPFAAASNPTQVERGQRRYDAMNQGNDTKDFIDELRKSAFSVLLLDYDGTLAPFSLDRDVAVPYPGVRAVLQNIAD